MVTEHILDLLLEIVSTIRANTTEIIKKTEKMSGTISRIEKKLSIDNPHDFSLN